MRCFYGDLPSGTSQFPNFSWNVNVVNGPFCSWLTSIRRSGSHEGPYDRGEFRGLLLWPYRVSVQAVAVFAANFIVPVDPREVFSRYCGYRVYLDDLPYDLFCFIFIRLPSIPARIKR